ncbi:MAG: isoprenylcysteine carboxylmethyltransferase family protein [Deltaproteobacteria bacterium]|nr:isoprenylcysteine carboxylmethyltransferase family protein [Deltaproteobacteria bacterium]
MTGPTTDETTKLIGRVLRWSLAGLVLGAGFWLGARTLRGVPGSHNVPFEHWYGNWPAVVIAAGLFTLFLLGFARPRRQADWRHAGAYTAFLISLFTEMFGLPLTIYVLASILGLPAGLFGMNESHLWAFALDRLRLLPLSRGVYLVMVVSLALIFLGASLVVIGWGTVYGGRDRLVTHGIYRHLRHPQYLGLILIIIAFNLQWPTLPTLLMAPVLMVMYMRLARREDQELARRFGRAFLEYVARTPAFMPGWSALSGRSLARSQ